MIQRALVALFFSITLGIIFPSVVLASPTRGSIDPRNNGYNFVDFVDAPDVGISGADSRINFGKFTSQQSSNVEITDEGITGYLWGATSGWIVTNCAQTTTGCTGSNGNFKISVDEDGTLSGFAWGENTGWINFGPFTLSSVPQIQIQEDGFFRGTNASTAGYAWSENFGWIVFDCSTATNCLYTDYRPEGSRQGSGGAGGTATQCSDGLDNDGDGFFDMEDPECGNGSTSEFPPGVTPPVTPPVIPGTTDPVVPTTPTEPSVPTEPTPDPETPGGFPDVIETVTDTVTDVVTGDIGLPEARDRVIELFLLIIAWFKALFVTLAELLLHLMQDPRARDILLQIALFGLGIIILLATLLAVFVPVVSFVQLTLYPRLLWQNILVFLGISNTTTPWGIVYNSATHQPLPFTEIAIIDSNKLVVATAITASDGTFSADVPDGFYTIGIGTYNTMIAGVADPLIYATTYNSGTTVQIVNNQPLQQFDIAVQGIPVIEPKITPFKEFLLYHEVSFTSISFLLFGIGLMASILYTIFFPSLFALGITIIYIAIAMLRGVGMFGSYSSVVLQKANETPITGSLVTVFDKYRHTVITKALTSRYGRVYLNLPTGYFYTTITTKEGAYSVIGQPFATRAGLFRKRFLI